MDEIVLVTAEGGLPGPVAFVLGVSVLSILGAVLPMSPWLLLPLPLLPLLARHLRAAERRPLTPWTGRFLLLFGVAYMLALGQP